MKRMSRVTLSGAILAAALLAGCGSGSQGAKEVYLDGSSTVFRISHAAQVDYTKKFGSGVKVLVGNHGTGGGFGRYLEGEVDIVDASRPAKPEEESKAREKGLDWTRFVVGYDGITVVLNPKNDFVKALTVEQLKKLFEPGSRVNTWKQLDPSWPDRKISIYAPDTDSGTFEFFAEAIIGQKDQRKDIQVSPDDNVLVKGVAGDGDGIGYFGYAYYAANQNKLRAAPIQDGPDAQPVAPSPETILDGSYKPLSRPLFLYAKNSAMKRPEVAHFLRYYIENVHELTTKGGYVPPRADDQEANLKALPPAASQ